MMEFPKYFYFRLHPTKKGTAVEIEDASDADVVEVIRCKDCKHYYFADNRIPQEQRFTCDLDGDRWAADSFCSFAERRTDE